MKEALKNLLKIQPRALQNLHALAHMDFTQPYFIEEYSGKFTENSILKVVDNYINEDFYRSHYNIYVLYKPDTNIFKWLWRDIYIAQIRKNTLLCTKDKIKTYDPYFWTKFDVMTMKKDFEEVRKHESTRYWIIIQHKSMEKYTEAIYYNKERYYVKEENGKTYVRPMSKNYPYIREFDIDKSGYNRGIYHDELKQRLAEARREKSAAAAKVYDNTEKLTEFTKRLTAIHSRITEILNQPQPDYKKISNATSKLWWRDNDIEVYKLNKFDSIEQVRSTENRIDSTLNEVAAILD